MKLPAAFSTVTFCVICGSFTSADVRAAEANDAPRWQSLFNGENLTGWSTVLSKSPPIENPDEIVQVADDAIHIYKSAPAGTEQPYGYICTDKDFSHYRLRLQYRWGDKRFVPRVDKIRDAGALYHIATPKSTHGIWPTCVECQVQEGDTGDLITVDTRCATYVDPATAKDEYPTFRDPSRGGVEHPNDWYVNASRTLDRLEGWNDVEIIVCGAEGAVHMVNGEVNHRLIDIEQPDGTSWKPLDKGKIALQIEGAEVLYRRIEICPLSPEEAAQALADPRPSKRVDEVGDIPPPAGPTGLAAITVPPGFEVELVADSNLVQHPMMACFDDRGRIFLSESDGVNRESVPQILAERPHRAIMLEDQDGDGEYDKRSIFADGLVLPNGAEWHDGALYICSAPYLWRFRDTDGDGRADESARIAGKFNFDGMSSAFHGPVLGPDGRFYWSGGQHGWRLEQCDGGAQQPPSGAGSPDADLAGPWTSMAPGAFSCWPDGSDAENLAYGGHNNPVETAFTEAGEVLGTVAVYDHLDDKRRDAVCHWIDGGVFNLDERNYSGLIRTGKDLTPVNYRGHSAPSGVTRYRSEQFGPEYRNNFFFAEFNTHKVYRLIVERDGATFRSRDEVFLSSSDPDAHFTDVFEDADGSLLVLDTGGWFRHGCPTSQIAKPTILGAIYRVRKIGSSPPRDPRGNQIEWANVDSKSLAKSLDDPRFVVRDRAVAELAKRGDSALMALHDCLNSGAADARLNAVWALTRMRTPAAAELVRSALDDVETPVQLAAAHSANVARDPLAIARLIELTVDADPAVRREVASALGRAKVRTAVPALLASARLEGGRFSDHAITMALIRIGDDEATAEGLSSASPDEQRITLIALDQMKSPLLTRDSLAELLDSRDKALEEAAIGVLMGRPEWADELVERLAAWIADPQLSTGQQASLRGAIRALYENRAVQELVAKTLIDARAHERIRLLLLEAVGLVESDRLPDAWTGALGSCLNSDRPAIVAQVVSVIAERGLAGFEATLEELALAEDRPLDVRIAAAAAAIGNSPDAPGNLFAFLLESCRSSAASFDRLAAAEAIGKCKLSPDQLQQVAATVAQAGPIELPALLKPFEAGGGEAIGLTLVAALRQSPGASSLSGEGIARLLETFPPSVSTAGQPLVAAASAGYEDRAAHMQQVVDSIVGGDPARGREVFFGQRAACSSCHRIDGEGGNIGPNLSDIGKIRTHRDLVESILYPSASFAREYEPYNILTAEGKAHSGVISRRTVQAVYLRAPDRTEIRLARADIEEIQPSNVSVMPQGLDRVLTEEELSNLVSFLSSRR